MSILVINNGRLTSIKIGKQMTGEKIPGDLKTWDYFGSDPNQLLKWNYDVLQGRSVTLYHTHSPVAAAINKLTNYAIGPGLVFRSQPDWKLLEITQEKAKDWGMRFQKLIHYSFKLLNYYEKQSLVFRTGLMMGDSLLFFDKKYNKNDLPFDLVEAGGDQIDFQKDTENCTLGIYHDDMLRRKGIAQLNKKDRTDFQDSNGDQNVIQFYLKLMARQLRGYPLAYRIIAAAKNNDRWWDATLARAVLEATMFASVKDSTGDVYQQVDELHETLYNEDGMQVNSETMTSKNVANLGSGNIISYTKGGGPVEFSDLKTPSSNFDKMHKAYIEMVGMGTDVPPECVLSSYPTSFTAHKGAINDFKKSYEKKRNTYVNTVNYSVIKELAKYFFMSGLIEMPHPAFFNNAIIQQATLAGIWMGPVPGHINPQQEVTALISARDNALITPADAAAQYGHGGEFEDFIEEWEEQMAMWKSKPKEEQQEAVVEELEEMEEPEEEKQEQPQMIIPMDININMPEGKSVKQIMTVTRDKKGNLEKAIFE
jgi:hypothetical protein